MMQRSQRNEIIVGLFVLLAFVVLLAMTFVIKGSTGPGSYRLQISYDDVAGLDIGSPVFVSGFRRGQVVDMEAAKNEEGNTVVIVTARISPTIPIYKNARAYLRQQGFIGDKQIEIDPGTPEAGKASRTEMIVGVPFRDFTTAFDNVGGVITDLQATMTKVREITTDPERLAKIDTILTNLASSTERLDAMLAENRESLRASLANIETVSARSVEVADRADAILTDAGAAVQEMRTAVNQAVADLRTRMESLMQRADTIGANTDALLVDGRRELERVSENLRVTTENVNRVLEDVRSGKGTVGRLVNDPRPFDDLQESIAALRAVLMQQQDSFYDRTLPYRQRPAPSAVAPGGSQDTQP
jgi:phospholipid/cholesterol/gamma-HCH transport system substrate-binding protein